VNCCCFLDISIYSFLYVAASNQQTPVFKAWHFYCFKTIKLIKKKRIQFQNFNKT
jgi:hypothetical protein